MISYYFMMSLYTSILRIYETSNNMCILFDTAVKEKGRIRVVFSNFTHNMLQFVPKKQSTCHVFLHLNSTQASPEGDAFAAICTQRRRAVQAMSFPNLQRLLPAPLLGAVGVDLVQPDDDLREGRPAHGLRVPAFLDQRFEVWGIALELALQ